MRMRNSILLAFCVFGVLFSAIHAACPKSFPKAALGSGYCAYEWTSGIGAPRGIWVNSKNEVLVLQKSPAQVILLWEEGGSVHKSVLGSANGINHALIYHNGYLYVSSPTTVFRWRYTEGNRTNLGTPETIVRDVPCCGHTSRTLIIDAKGLLYVQSGSASNVDNNSAQSMIRRFDITTIPNGGIQWSTGEVFASGLRNEVGLRFDASGNMWGVENGRDNLARDDLGGDIHNDNPSEEFNMFSTNTPGKFYGYPYCWSQYRLNRTDAVGTQWADPTFINDGTHTDAWCKNTANVVPPAYNLPAHVAPLDILFYPGGTFPAAKGDAFVSFRGSWNRNPPQGYRVVHVTFQNGKPVKDDPIFYYQGPGETANDWTVRPVGLAMYKCGNEKECMLVTSDNDNKIIAIHAA